MVFFIFIFHLYSTAPASDLFRQLGEKITELYGARIGYFPGDANYIVRNISHFYGKLKPDLSVYGAFLRKTCANRVMVNKV
jgi:hypothetical protein